MGKREVYFKQLFKEEFGIEIDPEELRADFEAVVRKLRGAGVEHKGLALTPDPSPSGRGEQDSAGGEVMAALVRMALDVGAMLEQQEANQQAVKGLREEVESLRDKSARLEAEQRMRPRADESDETALEGDEAAALLKAMAAKRVERFGVIEYEEV